MPTPIDTTIEIRPYTPEERARFFRHIDEADALMGIPPATHGSPEEIRASVIANREEMRQDGIRPEDEIALRMILQDRYGNDWEDVPK